MKLVNETRLFNDAGDQEKKMKAMEARFAKELDLVLAGKADLETKLAQAMQDAQRAQSLGKANVSRRI